MPKFTPYPWRPEPAPSLDGGLGANTLLAEAELWSVGAEGPEDVVINASGVAFCGTADGVIRSVTGDGVVREVAVVGGRPLGIEWHGDDLLVCNADLGLQIVTMSGIVETLADSIDGVPFRLTNNAAVASDGTIYFTVSSTRWPLADYVKDMVEGQPTGRLFARSPSGDLRILTDGLQFANGVALDADGASVFVAETSRYRVHRHWITGDRMGETEAFLENLPGFPDNLSVGGGLLWVALASPRQAIVDFMGPRNWMRRVTNAIPDAVKPKPVRHGIVLGYDETGTLVHNLQDSTGAVAITTSARFHDGRLFVGGLHDPHIAVVTL